MAFKQLTENKFASELKTFTSSNKFHSMYRKISAYHKTILQVDK